mmetsp:Transcript_27728/g.34279  ORF Transcript_27728/g.34279 Transcript_27728/m.34279 type:complete len:457 (-) Transcript_27728:53-1423(-)
MNIIIVVSAALICFQLSYSYALSNETNKQKDDIDPIEEKEQCSHSYKGEDDISSCQANHNKNCKSTPRLNDENNNNNKTTYQIFELILADSHEKLDPTLPKTVSEIKNRGGHRCWHKHSTFLEHLLGVHNILRLWGQSYTTGRVGLLHSAYSNSYVNLALFDPNNENEREYMRSMIGSEAEELVYLFCIIDRQSVVVDTLLKQGYIPNEGLYVPHLRNESITVHLSAETLRLLVIFTMADIADQYFGWQDKLFGGVEQNNSMLIPGKDDVKKHESNALWPGSSKPGLWMNYVSELGLIAKTYNYRNEEKEGGDKKVQEKEINDLLPPVFANCSQSLSRNDEAKARDLYWSIIMMEMIPSDEEIICTLEEASKYNPWFFECHVMLAQKYLHVNENEKARVAAERALELQMEWGTAYDKRMTFPAWVAWTRVLHQRACDETGWPTNSWDVNNLGMVHG